MGMPILYYKADSTKLKHPLPGDSSVTIINAGITNYIYNVYDNQDLIDMGLPWWPLGPVHPLASAGGTPEGASVDFPKKFYDITRDTKISTGDRPVRADSYILMSAGFDGEYGTKDDIYNFGD
jgi:hypothetical protein